MSGLGNRDPLSASDLATRGLLKVPEVSDHLGVSQRTVRGWIASGKLPVVRLSARCVRIRPEDLEALIEGGRRA
ncbi:MAG: helix-turn-helix domain-containing protein [Planctomycetes bacterium]|nr:helix-turn-helix domain-containing protein [Planctomycetota bacterium]